MPLSHSSMRSRRQQSYRPMADINFTPFVDVMMVLLIVFMITAPLLTAGVPVDLPDSNAAQLKEQDDKPLEVTINGEREIYIGETEVELDRLVAMLKAITNNDPERRIFIRADQSLQYGEVMSILGGVNSAGFKKVALITIPAVKTP